MNSATVYCSICGSSWISGTYILTAAHCVDPAGAEVNYFENANFNSQFPSDFSGESGKVSGANIKIHPNWNMDDVVDGWDIALLNTQRSDPYPFPIKLADISFFDALTNDVMFKTYGTGKMAAHLDVSHTLLSARPLNRLDCDTDMYPFKYYINGEFQGNYREGLYIIEYR